MTIFTPRPQWIVDLINELAGPGAGGVWGAISGTLSDQTDLQSALNAKVDDSQISAFGATLIDDADAAAARTTLGLGTAATLSTSDIDERARDAVGTALVAGGGVSITPNDGADTITISASSSGGILSGTSFPGSPASGDRFYRTDRNIDYFYDGTRWLSTQIFTVGFAQGTGGISIDTNLVFNIPYLPTYDCYLIEWDTSYTRTATGEWDFILSSLDSAGALTTIDTQDGSADATSTWINRSRSLTTLLTSSVKALRIAADEVSGTALIIHAASVQYRLVG